MLFDEAFKETVGHEGGYSNNPNDAGGETMYGITIKTARAFGYNGPMKDMPLATAKAIYKEGFWDTIRLDAVGALSPAIAKELFDTNVNIAVGQAGHFLQRALNCFNSQAKLYGDITDDGKIGQATVDALKAYFVKRGKFAEVVMLKALNAQQGEYYFKRCEARTANEDFVFGWYANRVSI